MKLRRLLSGDETTITAFFVLGIVISAFFKQDELRRMFGAGTGALAVLCVSGALAWRSLLRRGFVWLDPAVLTWSDFAPGRDATVRRRMLGGWLGRLALIGYAWALIAALQRLPRTELLAGSALLLAAALLALAEARAEQAAFGLDEIGPLLLALLAVPALGTSALVTVTVALAACALAVLLARRAAHAGRVQLVTGARERMLRSVARGFLDPMMLVPAARGLPVGIRLRRPVVLRLTVLGMAGRARYLLPAALYLITAFVVHRAVPALPAAWPVTVGGYLALVPLAGGLGELYRMPGRRRWLATSDHVLRLCTAGALLVPGAVFAGVLVLLGLPPLASLGVLAAIGAVVRTVTRPLPSYDDLLIVDVGIGLAPGRLVAQAVRGPDLAVLGALALSAPPAVAVVAVAIIALYGVLR